MRQWLETARDSRWHRPYTELVYQPMLEVMQLLRQNGYKTYFVTGGGQDFLRAYAEPVYGIPPEQVVGTMNATKFSYDAKGKPILTEEPRLLLNNVGPGKPEGIQLMVGRRPQAAFGNSDGDKEMLEYTQAGGGVRLMMLVHHDDAAREYAYGAQSKVGTFPDSLMAEAAQRGWVVISMQKDWKRIFAWE
ncbi:HAD family hydrolase [Desulfovibrio sp. DV]|uniref:HAD family hydrolase n=1 Tax=Desulfovibrio sp. DV TaxID=1844708 RepID=UPI0020C96ABD|nr:HAD family hydrolase [Desulfovibrio sp. DV]